MESVKKPLMENIFFRLAVVCLLSVLGVIAAKELRKVDKEVYKESHEPQLRSENRLGEGESMPDSMIPPSEVRNPIKLLTYFIILAAGVGFVTVQWIIPMLGDAVSTATYSSGEKLGPSEHAKGLSLITQGNYQAALDEFRHLAIANPLDRFAIVEIVKLQLGKFEDVDGAIATLRNALSQEWPEADGTYFAQRLSDLYREEKGDLASAKEILQHIIQQFPGSPSAGNATHKLREIEEAEFLASRGGH